MIDQIRADYRELRFLVKLRVMNENALGAYVRRHLGWCPTLPEKERAAIKKAAAKEMENPTDPRIAVLIAGVIAAREKFTVQEKGIEKRLRKAARKLPVWDAWARDVCGFGDLGLAVVVGIAGDLSEWRSLPGLYKRLGLAPFQRADGEIRACSTWRMGGGLAAEDWTEAGYSPQNRAAMYAYVGEPIVRQGPYAEEYQRRRVHEARKLGIEDPTKQNQTLHRRAHRYVTKRLIKHLWQHWRGEVPAAA